jgi:uncharacterized protein DUF5678
LTEREVSASQRAYAGDVPGRKAEGCGLKAAGQRPFLILPAGYAEEEKEDGLHRVSDGAIPHHGSSLMNPGKPRSEVTMSQLLEAPLENELDPELQRELLEHAGQWVAITRSRLVAFGDDAAAVLTKAKEEGVESPILYFVPKEEGTSYYY